jgi:hypothetical protein
MAHDAFKNRIAQDANDDIRIYLATFLFIAGLRRPAFCPVAALIEIVDNTTSLVGASWQTARLAVRPAGNVTMRTISMRNNVCPDVGTPGK